jgi:CRISPR-associated protein Csb2
VLVEVPPNCPLSGTDIEGAFSGILVSEAVDSENGEVIETRLVPAEDRDMLRHYGVDDRNGYRVWRSVTPVALPESAARRRIDPQRLRNELATARGAAGAELRGAKSGAERLAEESRATSAVLRALRHSGVAARAEAIRLQREPLAGRGARAEDFAPGTRFAKERLWHVEITFAKPLRGPLLIGDGRYLGLGLMAPARHADGVLGFAIVDGLTDHAEPLELARSLRRAVMSRVQEKIGERGALPAFFSGHAPDGTAARSGRHEHLAFVFDAPRKRLLIIAPHMLERREPSKGEHENLRTLDDALDDFRELRAGRAGRLSLFSFQAEMQDPLFTRARTWRSLTPYRVTRHAKMSHAAAALDADLLVECRRAGLPRPQIEVAETFARPGAGLCGRVTLRFRIAVAGPVLLGRDRHFGGGLFVPVEAGDLGEGDAR